VEKKYHIPRYLGFRDLISNSDTFTLKLGYTHYTEKELGLDEQGLDFIRFFLEPKTIAEASCHFELDSGEVLDFVENLQREGVLKEHLSIESESYNRYDRHLLYYEMLGENQYTIQEKLKNSKVGLIGMGGIGNWVSLGLIGSGLGELRLIDFDDIELSNLTRQVLFDEEDIGKLKVECAQKKLELKNSDTKVSIFKKEIKGEQDIIDSAESLDIIILSADTPPEIHTWLDCAAKKLGIPYLNAGYRDGVGVVGPLTIHGRTSCYQCYKPKNSENVTNELKTEISNVFYSRYQAPSFGPINAVVSNIAVLETLKFLGGFGELNSFDTEINVDAVSLGLNFKKYSRDENCWHCNE